VRLVRGHACTANVHAVGSCPERRPAGPMDDATCSACYQFPSILGRPSASRVRRQSHCDAWPAHAEPRLGIHACPQRRRSVKPTVYYARPAICLWPSTLYRLRVTAVAWAPTKYCLEQCHCRRCPKKTRVTAADCLHFKTLVPAAGTLTGPVASHIVMRFFHLL
jgi:hypothetical protein